jgi:hypothetical protein
MHSTYSKYTKKKLLRKNQDGGDFQDGVCTYLLYENMIRVSVFQAHFWSVLLLLDKTMMENKIVVLDHPIWELLYKSLVQKCKELIFSV